MQYFVEIEALDVNGRVTVSVFTRSDDLVDRLVGARGVQEMAYLRSVFHHDGMFPGVTFGGLVAFDCRRGNLKPSLKASKMSFFCAAMKTFHTARRRNSRSG
jgi:hypothetical protein